LAKLPRNLITNGRSGGKKRIILRQRGRGEEGKLGTDKVDDITSAGRQRDLKGKNKKTEKLPQSYRAHR